MSTENQTAEVRVEAPVETENQTNVTTGVETLTTVAVPAEVWEGIQAKAVELKEKHKLRKVFIAVVEGEDGDSKPFYVAYLRRPSLPHFSQYMNFVQKDFVQANKMLAGNVFLGGDRELVDDDELFLFGLMNQLTPLIESRNAEIVKK